MYYFETGGNIYVYSTIDNKIYNYKENTVYDKEDSLNTQYTVCQDYVFDKMSMFIIEVTQQCNLRCHYCCYSGNYNNRRTHNNLFMTDDTVMRCIKFIKQHADAKAPQITVCFYGGEALLAKKQIDFIINNLRNEMQQVNFLFSISTNGILLSPDVADWICSLKDTIVTITIDGDKQMNDKNRVLPTGKGSFDLIMNNIHDFWLRHHDEFYKKIQFISTLKSTHELVELNDFWMSHELLKGSRPRHISMIIPNTKKGEAISLDLQSYKFVLDKAIESHAKGNEDILTDELKRLINRVQHRKIFTLPQTQRFKSCINEPYSCFITTNGNLYTCERFCTGLSIGSLSEGVNIEVCKRLNKRFLDKKRQYCSSCWAQRLCQICALCLNDEDDFLDYCDMERTRIELALKYYCCYLLLRKSNVRV